MKKILIVDDDFQIRETLKAILKQKGFECFTAEDGVQGLDMFSSLAPDMVITDGDMPHMNGLQLTKQLRAIGATQPILMHSGSPEMAEIFETIVGGTKFFGKHETAKLIQFCME